MFGKLKIDDIPGYPLQYRDVFFYAEHEYYDNLVKTKVQYRARGDIKSMVLGFNFENGLNHVINSDINDFQTKSGFLNKFVNEDRLTINNGPVLPSMVVQILTMIATNAYNFKLQKDAEKRNV